MQEKEKIVIIGASGHAKVIIDTIELMGEYEIGGLIDSYKLKGEKILNYEVIGTEEDLPRLLQKGISKGIIAIGDNWTRFKMYSKIQQIAPDFQFISVIHPSAIVSRYAKIGKGVAVLCGVIINADAVIEDCCILNTNASLGHDSIMQRFSSIAPSCTIGGTVTIGEFSAISIGATVNQNLTIGKHTVIGSGSVVVRSIEDNSVAYGVPAKVIRARKKEDPYLIIKY